MIEVCLTLSFLGGHRKQIIFLTITVIVFWSDPLLHSLKIACLCEKPSRYLWFLGFALYTAKRQFCSKLYDLLLTLKKHCRAFYSMCTYRKLRHFGDFIQVQPQQSSQCFFLFFRYCLFLPLVIISKRRYVIGHISVWLAPSLLVFLKWLCLRCRRKSVEDIS